MYMQCAWLLVVFQKYLSALSQNYKLFLVPHSSSIPLSLSPSPAAATRAASLSPSPAGQSAAPCFEPPDSQSSADIVRGRTPILIPSASGSHIARNSTRKKQRQHKVNHYLVKPCIMEEFKSVHLFHVSDLQKRLRSIQKAYIIPPCQVLFKVLHGNTSSNGNLYNVMTIYMHLYMYRRTSLNKNHPSSSNHPLFGNHTEHTPLQLVATISIINGRVCPTLAREREWLHRIRPPQTSKNGFDMLSQTRRDCKKTQQSARTRLREGVVPRVFIMGHFSNNYIQNTTSVAATAQQGTFPQHTYQVYIIS